MNTALIIALLTVIGSGVSAGIVTFWMNFWKAELDFRRAKIEELYAAVHKYTMAAPTVAIKIRTKRSSLDEANSVTEDFNRITLLIDLYFPNLLPTFQQLKTLVEAYIVQDGKFRTDDREFREGYIRIIETGNKLKAEVVALSRQGGLRALIETVQQYDRASFGD